MTPSQEIEEVYKLYENHLREAPHIARDTLMLRKINELIDENEKLKEAAKYLAYHSIASESGVDKINEILK